MQNRNLPALGFRPNLQYPGYPIAGWQLFWASEKVKIASKSGKLSSKEMLKDFDSALTRQQSPPQGFRPVRVAGCTNRKHSKSEILYL